MKKHLINFLLVIISCSVPLFLSEYIFHKGLFNNANKSFKKYRDQTLYAADWDENFWKLYHKFTGKEAIGHNTLIGWNYPSYFNRNFFHQHVPYIKKRRVTLLYGDSFAQCVAGAETFQDIINADTAFAKDNYFINYGTGAFGVDQIYTLCKNTYYKFENPVVVFSFMSEDIDRSVLHIREGIKPYYTLEGDSLVFNPQPYVGNFDSFIKENPVSIKSLLWRKFLYSNANFLPKKLTRHLTGEIANHSKVIALNKKILQAAINELRQSKTDFIFLVFNSMGDVLMPKEDNWRMQFITDFIERNNIKPVYTKDLLPLDEHPDSTKLYTYYLTNDGHPNTTFNKIISRKIMDDVQNGNYEKNSSPQRIQYPYTYTHIYDSVTSLINSNDRLHQQVLLNVQKDKMPLDTAVKNMAMWLLYEKYN
jgi:hypothetical protein